MQRAAWSIPCWAQAYAAWWEIITPGNLCQWKIMSITTQLTWNGLKKRLIPLFKSLVKERGRKSYIIRGTFDSISPPPCKQIFWIPFNTPANGTSTKSQKKELPFKVVYFSFPNIKRRGERLPHAKLHSSKLNSIHFYRLCLFHGFILLCPLVNRLGSQVCLLLGPLPFTQLSMSTLNLPWTSASTSTQNSRICACPNDFFLDLLILKWGACWIDTST